MTIAVDAAGPPHAALLAALHGRCFTDQVWDEAAMAALLAMPGALALLARDGEEPCGFVLARFAGGEGEIISIGVVPDHRGRGLATLLARHVLDRAAGRAGELFLEVAADNDAALALYRRLGFCGVGRRPRYYADGRDAVLMRLKL